MIYKCVFVHGWGENAQIWDSLQNELARLLQIEAQAIDLGFDGEKSDLASDNQKYIFITHSYGCLWALKHKMHNIGALIAVNGFLNFSHFVPNRIVQNMQKKMEHSPQSVMDAFWTNNDLAPLKDIHPQPLKDSLIELETLDFSHQLSKFSFPVLSLFGDSDPLLPTDKMIEEWQGVPFKICHTGKHDLPVSASQWCAKEIHNFITNELQLER